MERVVRFVGLRDGSGAADDGEQSGGERDDTEQQEGREQADAEGHRGPDADRSRSLLGEGPATSLQIGRAHV